MHFNLAPRGNILDASTDLVKGDTEHRYTANLLNCKLYMILFVDVSVHMAFFI